MSSPTTASDLRDSGGESGGAGCSTTSDSPRSALVVVDADDDQQAAANLKEKGVDVPGTAVPTQGDGNNNNNNQQAKLAEAQKGFVVPGSAVATDGNGIRKKGLRGKGIGKTGVPRPSEDAYVDSAAKDPRRTSATRTTVAVGAHHHEAADSIAGALKTPKGLSRLPQPAAAPDDGDEVDVGGVDELVVAPESPQTNQPDTDNNDVDPHDTPPPTEAQQDVHLVEANLVVDDQDINTDSRQKRNEDLQLAEIVDPEETNLVNKCIPKTTAAKLFCFGLALLVTGIVVTSIVCGSGSCSGAGPTNGIARGPLFSPSPTTTTTTTQPSLRPSEQPTNPPTAAPSLHPTIQPTNAPTVAPTIPLFNLPNFTLEAIRSDPQSAQSKAYRWLLDNIHVYEAVAGNDTTTRTTTTDSTSVPTTLLDQWRIDQLFALATIYYSFNGDDWAEVNRQQWLDPTVHECDWTPIPHDGDLQINCQQEEGRLQEFMPDSFLLPLVGTLPAELVLLSSMTHLEIDECGLKGTLDDFLPQNFADLSNQLISLSFYWSDLEGTIPGSIIGSLTNLRAFHLAAGKITGPIPSQMAALTDLRYLTMNDHWGMSGTLPTEVLASWTRLAQLRVDDNLLSGTLPTQLGLLDAMWDLWLHDNDFVGTIPSEIALLTNLEKIYLYYNNLSGTLPQEICALPSIQEIGLDCSSVPCPVNCTACTCQFGN